jgi:hypothetical protein
VLPRDLTPRPQARSRLGLCQTNAGGFGGGCDQVTLPREAETPTPAALTEA